MNAIDKMKNVVNVQKIEALLESATALMNNFGPGTDIAVEIILNELEKRMPASKFIAFCDNL
jgi:hypothetical protein